MDWKAFWNRHKNQIVWWAVGLVILPFLAVKIASIVFAPEEISYGEFVTMVENEKVDSVIIQKNNSRLVVVGKDGSMYQTEHPEYEGFKKELLEKGIDTRTVVPKERQAFFRTVLTIAFYGSLIYLYYYYVANHGKSDKMETPATIPDTTFNDIAGYEEQKQDLSTYVEYLKNPKKFVERGANMPKGVLLYGPPGTGKTLFARAIAGEANVPFYSVSGSDFVEMFVGVGAKRVRKLFENARKNTPCIIFIDEIDAIGAARGVDNNSERAQTINALLSEMDGFEKDSGILVLATTNRIETLDPALIRSGRFDSHIAIPLPKTKEERLEIMKLHIRKRKLAENIRLEDLAEQWVGFSGADIESVLNEASIIAVQRDLPVITRECLDEAFYKKILKGHIRKTAQAHRNKKELEIVAYHEAGHAVCRKLLGVGDVSKVTILSTTSGAGGATFNVPEKMGLFSREELESEIKVLYAGRAGEYLYFNKDPAKVTTGAQADIKQATRILKSMIMECGLQREQVMIDFNQFSHAEAYVLEKTKELSQRLYDETVRLLERHFPLLREVAECLIEKETIEGEELDVIVNDYLEQLRKNAS